MYFPYFVWVFKRLAVVFSTVPLPTITITATRTAKLSTISALVLYFYQIEKENSDWPFGHLLNYSTFSAALAEMPRLRQFQRLILHYSCAVFGAGRVKNVLAVKG